MMKTTILCTAAALLCASAAYAHTTPARPAAQAPAAAAPQVRPQAAPTNPGPVIPGVCVMDSQAAISGSAAGRAAAARMQTLTQQVRAELTTEGNAISTEDRAIRALPEAQRTARISALQTRVNTFQQTGAVREEELRRTQGQALNRIVQALEPVVLQLYVQRGCGLMVDRGSVIYANPAMDVTQQAVQALGRAVPTITFDRVGLPAQTAAQPAAGAPR